MKHVQENVQTTMVPAGGATIVDFKVDVPGTFILVDHSLSRAFNKGALGMLKVTGPDNRRLYSGKEIDEVYLGQQSAAGSAASSARGAARRAKSGGHREESRDREHHEGHPARAREKSFTVLLLRLSPSGWQGAAGRVSPAPADSDYLKADKERAIRVVLKGLSGPITVNGKPYNNVMPPQSSPTTKSPTC